MPDDVLAIDEVMASVTPSGAPAAEGAEAAAGSDDAAKKKKIKVKSAVHAPSGIAHVDATFNNTKVYISDLRGNVLTWCSAGRLGFKGSKKSTAYVAQQVATDAGKRAAAMGVKEVQVRINGPGAGRESAVRGIAAAGLEITALEDITPVPHNGCRPPKRRRI